MTEIKPAMVCALAAGAGVMATALAVKPWKAFYRRRGWVDDPGPRKIHAEATVLAGGAAVLAGFLVALLAVWGLSNTPSAMFDRPGIGPGKLFGLVLGAIGIFLLGFWDDVRDLRPRAKFCGQLLIAAAVTAVGIRLPVFTHWPFVQFVFSALFVVFMINAMNFLDNMNGLCGGLGVIAVASLGGYCLRTNRPILAAICLAAAGACAGFVPFNYPRASVFLGDAGSHLVGFLAVVLAVLACEPPPGETESGRWLVPLLVLLVPFYDIVQVMLVRSWAGRPVYVGDTNHVSHQLVRAGMSSPMAVLLLWVVAMAGGVVVVALAR